MILKAKNLAYMEKKTAYGTISLMGSKNNYYACKETIGKWEIFNIWN